MNQIYRALHMPPKRLIKKLSGQKEIYTIAVRRAPKGEGCDPLPALGEEPYSPLPYTPGTWYADPLLYEDDNGKRWLFCEAFNMAENRGDIAVAEFDENDHLLPDDILWRQKAAFSDAVGHSMVDDLKAYAEEKYTDEEFEARRQLYPFAMPFTKESLLYREIFEKYYPGQAEMVKDFWMPNKSWEGCNVNDPSARVLSNYGASGE